MKHFLFLLLLTCFSCTHLNEKITKLPFHSSKSKALDTLGSPFQIKRKKGLDYWIYKFKLNKKSYTRSIIFKKGYSIRKNSLQRYPKPTLILDGVENFEDYKQAIKQFQQQKKH